MAIYTRPEDNLPEQIKVNPRTRISNQQVHLTNGHNVFNGTYYGTIKNISAITFDDKQISGVTVLCSHIAMTDISDYNGNRIKLDKLNDIDDIELSIDDLSSAIDSLDSKQSQNITDLSNKTFTAIESTSSYIIERENKICSSLSNNINNICSQISISINDICSSLSNNINDICSSISISVNAICASLSNNINDICASISTTIDDKINAVYQSISSVSSDICSYISSNLSNFLSDSYVSSISLDDANKQLIFNYRSNATQSCSISSIYNRQEGICSSISTTINNLCSQISNNIDVLCSYLNNCIDEKVHIDQEVSDLSIDHISNKEFYEIVSSSDIPNGHMYIISGDTFDVYGQRIENVANGISDHDAVNVGQVNDICCSISSCINNIRISLSTDVDNLCSQISSRIDDLCSQISDGIENKIHIDKEVSDLSIDHISNKRFYEIVSSSDISSSQMYIITGDTVDVYGMKVENVANGISAHDAINVGQVNEICSSILSEVKTICSDISSSVNAICSDLSKEIINETTSVRQDHKKDVENLWGEISSFSLIRGIAVNDMAKDGSYVSCDENGYYIDTETSGILSGVDVDSISSLCDTLPSSASSYVSADFEHMIYGDTVNALLKVFSWCKSEH